MQQPPRELFNIEAEQALLGAILTNSMTAMPQLIDTLPAEAFHEPFHSEVYRLLVEDFTAGRWTTPITLKDRLPEIAADQRAPSATTGQYLAAIASAAISVLDLHGYAEVILELWGKRRLRDLCLQTLEELESPGAAMNDLATASITQLHDITAGNDTAVFKSERDIGLEILQSMYQPLECTPTGLERLDKAMGGGMYPECVYGVFARYKAGKTGFAGTISDNLSARGVRHAYFALEMGPKGIHQRKLARRMQVYPSDFRNPERRQTTRHIDALNAAIHNGGNACLYADVPNISADRLKRLAAAAVYRHKVKGIILDYWQLVEGKERNQTDAAHLGAVAQWLAKFARQQNIWIFVLGQLNQDGNTRGSEGASLAFTQIYDLCREEDDSPDAWLSCRASRDTKATDVGNKGNPAYRINDYGPYFEEMPNARYSMLEGEV